LVASLDAASRTELEGDELLIEFTPEAKHSRDTLAKADNAKALREACSEVCGRNIGIRFAVKDGTMPATSHFTGSRRASFKQQIRQAAAQNPPSNKSCAPLAARLSISRRSDLTSFYRRGRRVFRRDRREE